jgi:cytoskeletal protein CcmA (bactofilin family)
MIFKNNLENKKQTELASSSSINLISAGTVIEGDIKSEGDIRVDGTVNGSIYTKGKLVIGASGVVKGEINCKNADVSGTVKGKTSVSELLSLTATAKLSGDIISNKLAIEPGATFTGTCSMGAVIKDFKNNGQQQESERKLIKEAAAV